MGNVKVLHLRQDNVILDILNRAPIAKKRLVVQQHVVQNQMVQRHVSQDVKVPQFGQTWYILVIHPMVALVVIGEQ